MKLTALDVRKREFRKRMRGFDPSAVKEFMGRVARRIEALTRENLGLRDQLIEAQESIKSVLAREQETHQLLEQAKKLGKDALAAAEHRGEIMIAEAELKAESLLRDARENRVSMMDEIVRLRRQKERFYAEMRALVEIHGRMLEDVEVDDWGLSPSDGFLLDGDELDDLPVFCDDEIIELPDLPVETVNERRHVSRHRRKKGGSARKGNGAGRTNGANGSGRANGSA